MALDFETTGTNVQTDRVIEVGAILYSTGQKKAMESTGMLVKTDVRITEEVTDLTGIHPGAVARFGFEPADAYSNLLDLAELAEAYIGQNVLRFDKRVAEAWGARDGRPFPEKLWIDTMYDLPGQEGKHLGYMAADRGFLNLFPHAALADCQTVLKLLEFEDFDKVLERARSPFVILQARQGRHENDLAKKQKFRWNPDYKIWWKAVKQLDVEKVCSACSFDVSYAAPEILLDKLWEN